MDVCVKNILTECYLPWSHDVGLHVVHGVLDVVYLLFIVVAVIKDILSEG